MLAHLRRSVVFAVVCFVFFGLLYSLAGTGVAQALFPHQANGSLTAVGSPLIGQTWTSTRWFHGRPDNFGPYAANPKTGVAGGDNPLVANGVKGESGATNLGPRSKALVADTRLLVAWWHAHGVDPTTDLVTTSGSGYDPDITPTDALVQIPMVSKATGVSPAALRHLIASQTQGRQLGFLGSPIVNVLDLNRALARLE
ncbi:MAG: potassium-transporting ATPase subunit C [Actinomycetota bacterium]|jgi:K+-transporting ATPase ATPase C chain|nr:potassium-transporting ATPase subunit C [Actinomycetota bacterium]MDA8281194.1 potassium-transporting ATPase subunit C [Actinomycetota bacterium]